MPITHLDMNTNSELVVQALRRDGAVVVENLAEPDLVDRVGAELRPRLDASGLKSRNAFNGSRTLRCNSVLTTAPSAAALVAHNLLVAVTDAILLPHCAAYRVGSMTLSGLARQAAGSGMAR